MSPSATPAAQLGGLTVTVSGACQPTATTSLPVSLGDINPGGSQTGAVSVNFANCAKLLKFNVILSSNANGGATTGATSLTGVTQ